MTSSGGYTTIRVGTRVTATSNERFYAAGGASPPATVSGTSFSGATRNPTAVGSQSAATNPAAQVAAAACAAAAGRTSVVINGGGRGVVVGPTQRRTTTTTTTITTQSSWPTTSATAATQLPGDAMTGSVSLPSGAVVSIQRGMSPTAAAPAVQVSSLSRPIMQKAATMPTRAAPTSPTSVVLPHRHSVASPTVAAPQFRQSVTSPRSPTMAMQPGCSPTMAMQPGSSVIIPADAFRSVIDDSTPTTIRGGSLTLAPPCNSSGTQALSDAKRLQGIAPVNVEPAKSVGGKALKQGDKVTIRSTFPAEAGKVAYVDGIDGENIQIRLQEGTEFAPKPGRKLSLSPFHLETENGPLMGGPTSQMASTGVNALNPAIVHGTRVLIGGESCPDKFVGKYGLVELPDAGEGYARVRIEPGFSVHNGYISGGGTFVKEVLTIDEAKAKCALMGGLGFTHEGGVTPGPVLIYIKNKWDLQGTGWTSYRLDKDTSVAKIAMIGHMHLTPC